MSSAITPRQRAAIAARTMRRMYRWLGQPLPSETVRFLIASYFVPRAASLPASVKESRTA